MYWFDCARSDGWWRMKDSLVNDEKWLWLHRNGDLYMSDTCLKLKDDYYLRK